MNQTEKNSIYSQRCTNRAWIELNMENLKNNIHSIQKLLPPGCEIMAVLKDTAYGHGDTAIAAACSAFGIRSFAAATLSEGIRLRESGVTGEILILGFTPPEDAHMLYCYRMTQTVVDADYAKELDAYGFEIPVHVKIDTGMHRIGEDYRQLSISAPQTVWMKHARHMRARRSIISIRRWTAYAEPVFGPAGPISRAATAS